MKAVKITVSGSVQGVSYRAFTVAKATQLGIAGEVMNHPNGSVIIYAQGTEEQLHALIAECRKGPLLARVQEVVVQDEPVKHYTDFTISRFKS